MSSNPLIMGYGGGDLTAAGCRGRWSGCCAQPVCAGCGLWADRPGGSVQYEIALEVCNTRYALYKSTFLPFFTITASTTTVTVSLCPSKTTKIDSYLCWLNVQARLISVEVDPPRHWRKHCSWFLVGLNRHLQLSLPPVHRSVAVISFCYY